MSDFILLIIGALLATIGGVGGDEFRSWRERKRELKAMKISIIDELGEIKNIITNMHEVWEKSKVLHPSYITEILASTSIYKHARLRLFLIKDTELRKCLVNFYKKLKNTAKKSEGKLGTLADTAAATAEQAGFHSSFQALGTDAEGIISKLEKNKFTFFRKR